MRRPPNDIWRQLKCMWLRREKWFLIITVVLFLFFVDKLRQEGVQPGLITI